jgi:predicted membrane protein
MGTVLLTGVAAIVVWKILAGVVVGLLGLALKVGLVVLVVYFVLKLFNGKKKEEKEEEEEKEE